MVAPPNWALIRSGATFEALATTLVFFEDPGAALCQNVSVALAKGDFDDPLPGDLGDLSNVEKVDIRKLTPLRSIWPFNKTELDNEILKFVATLYEIPPERMPELRREEAQRRTARLVRMILGSTGIIIALVSALVWALISQRQIKQQALLATSRLLAEEAQQTLDTFPQRSLLLAVEALNTTGRAGQPLVPRAEEVLRNALVHTGGQGLGSHNDTVTALAISPDNHWLVTSGKDFTARLWDLTAPNPATTVRPLVPGHSSTIGVLAFSPDSHWLATGSYDHNVGLLDLTAPEPSATARLLRGHDDPILAVTISPDSHWLVTGSVDKTARLWDLTTPDPDPQKDQLAPQGWDLPRHPTPWP